ncbi:MAG: hypothetical protein BWY20_01533 [Spirochaetes bacterium ADurb.Bin215]|nr:MAG: hypothetical protein BWY20_01533 [Spirochaetes bacterium ADurb.Bin215]
MHEKGFKVAPLVIRVIGGGRVAHTLTGKTGKNAFKQTGVLRTDQFMHPPGNLFQLFTRRHPAGIPDIRLCPLLGFQARDPNHEKLVKIGRDNAEEPQPLEQGNRIL